MAYRTAHGSGADALVRVETLPASELPVGLLAPTGEPAPVVPDGPRDDTGRLLAGPGAVERARAAIAKRWAGERARAERVPVLQALGLRSTKFPDHLEPYLTDAEAFAKHEVERLAQTVGGGVVGAGPASMVQSAALMLACSRYLFAQGDPSTMAQAARLADSSKQQLLTAHELVAREAKARGTAEPHDGVSALDRRLGFTEPMPPLPADVNGPVRT